MMERIFKGLFFLSFLFLAYYGGLLTAHLNGYPYQKAEQLHKFLFAANEAQIIKRDLLGNRFYKARSNQTGVVRHVPGKAYDGYTLFSDANEAHALLVDMKGKVVHRWAYEALVQQNMLEDHPQFFRRVRLLPNGHLLGLYKYVGNDHRHTGLVELDNDSRVVMQYQNHDPNDYALHHDFDVAPNGDIYVLGRFYELKETYGIKGLNLPYTHDVVIQVGADGKQKNVFSLMKAFGRSGYTYDQDVTQFDIRHPSGDVLHTNAITYVTPQMAQQFPLAEPGDLLVSLYYIKALAVFDPDTGLFRKLIRLPWQSGFHDPTILPNGHILGMVNDYNRLNGARESAVLEMDPSMMMEVWKFQGSDAQPFYSLNRGSVYKLPNGNVLAYESTQGRIIEIAPNHDIVWDYRYPLRVGERVSVVTGGGRYSASQVPFVKASP